MDYSPTSPRQINALSVDSSPPVADPSEDQHNEGEIILHDVMEHPLSTVAIEIADNLVSPPITTPNAPLTATLFQQSLRSSPNPAKVLLNVLDTPECVDKIFPTRPCLVLDVLFRKETTQTRLNIAPVTKFSDKEINFTDLSPTDKELFLPIHPNDRDILSRDPIKTNPAWPRKDAYIMLQSLQVSLDRAESSDHITFICNENDFTRVRQLMEIRKLCNLSPVVANESRTPRLTNLNPRARPFTPNDISSPIPQNLNPLACSFIPRTPSTSGFYFYNRFTPEAAQPTTPTTNIPSLSYFPRFTPSGDSEIQWPVVLQLSNQPQPTEDHAGSLTDDIGLAQKIVEIVAEDAASGGTVLDHILHR